MSLYSRDANSLEAIAFSPTIPGIRAISSLVEVEIVNAFELRVFRNEITRKEADQGMLYFDKDIEAGVLRLLPLPEEIFGRATVLSMKHTAQLGARTIDILHVAAAIEYGAKSFCSFDTKQRTTAAAAGLKLSPMSKHL